MKTFKSGETVDYGFYASFWQPSLRFVSADGEPLEGREHATYVRVPLLLMLVLSPIIGGVYVLAFPFLLLGAVIGIAISPLVRALGGGVAKRGTPLVRMRWEPQAAYLDKSGESSGESGPSPPVSEGDDLDLDALEVEVRERRAQESAVAGADDETERD